jgi:hypothetical protein
MHRDFHYGSQSEVAGSSILLAASKLQEGMESTFLKLLNNEKSTIREMEMILTSMEDVPSHLSPNVYDREKATSRGRLRDAAMLA